VEIGAGSNARAAPTSRDTWRAERRAKRLVSAAAGDAQTTALKAWIPEERRHTRQRHVARAGRFTRHGRPMFGQGPFQTARALRKRRRVACADPL
jgi:hypothetical protein